MSLIPLVGNASGINHTTTQQHHTRGNNQTNITKKQEERTLNTKILRVLTPCLHQSRHTWRKWSMIQKKHISIIYTN